MIPLVAGGFEPPTLGYEGNSSATPANSSPLSPRKLLRILTASWLLSDGFGLRFPHSPRTVDDGKGRWAGRVGG